MSAGFIHAKGDLICSRYKILEYIGAGGMQEVYKSMDLLLNRTVALKVPKNKSASKRFQRSATVSARINHQNVAKTLDYVEAASGAYLIEEFISGIDLSGLQKGFTPLVDPMLAAFIFHHLARGLAASHHAGVVHRDLKPSNVMAVGGQFIREIKITDFGIAKLAEEELADAIEGGDESLTASQTAIGALPYMAPEMIKSIKNAGKHSDIWSLGAMMFELISGGKPFGSGLKSVPIILEAKMPPIPNAILQKMQFRSIGEQVYHLISQCLQLNQNLRPTADKLVEQCEQLCYPTAPREAGTVSRFPNNSWGFIVAEEGKDVFFHVESIYGSTKVKVGDRVLFSRHIGAPNHRAFPVIKMLPKKIV